MTGDGRSFETSLLETQQRWNTKWSEGNKQKISLRLSTLGQGKQTITAKFKRQIRCTHDAFQREKYIQQRMKILMTTLTWELIIYSSESREVERRGLMILVYQVDR